MNRVLITITARQLLGRKRTIGIGLVLALPIVIALIYRFGADVDPSTSNEEFAVALVSRLILLLLLPLVALVLGTAALGAEIEDGTAVFLLTKPVERWRIVVIKTLVASAATAVLVVPATVATAWIITGSASAGGVVAGLALGALAASVIYCAVFVALSAYTTRALVLGLVYVFVWDAIVSNLFTGLRWVSIRAYAGGWSGVFITITDRDVFDPALGWDTSIVAAIVVVAAALVFGSRALGRVEFGERG
jgi:ABC-2 type transport system permease protein